MPTAHLISEFHIDLQKEDSYIYYRQVSDKHIYSIVGRNGATVSAHPNRRTLAAESLQAKTETRYIYSNERPLAPVACST